MIIKQQLLIVTICKLYGPYDPRNHTRRENVKHISKREVEI